MGLFDREQPKAVPEDTHVAFPDDVEEPEYVVTYKHYKGSLHSHAYDFVVTLNGVQVLTGSGMSSDSKQEALAMAKETAAGYLENYVNSLEVPDTFVERIKPPKTSRRTNRAF
jgi:hypothetical protein